MVRFKKIGSNPNDVKSQISNSSLQDYRTKLRFLKVLLIDEISYVGNRFLYCIDERLRQIFTIDRPFGGVYVIFFGDLYQLKPVRDGPIFKKLTVRDLDKGAFYDSPWFSCELFTLKKIVRQSEPEWIYLLNRVRLGTFTIGDLSEINTLVDNPIPPTAHRACKTNKLVNKHNDEEMAKCSHIVEVYADEFIWHGADIPTEIQSQLIHKARRMDKTTTTSMLFKIVAKWGLSTAANRRVIFLNLKNFFLIVKIDLFLAKTPFLGQGSNFDIFIRNTGYLCVIYAI